MTRRNWRTRAADLGRAARLSKGSGRWLTRFEDRRLEWMLALYTLTLGLVLILPPLSMSSASFKGTLGMMTERNWGILYASVGLIHVVALHINGRAAWTPFARLLALLLNSQVFLAFAISLIPSNPYGTGVVTYSFVAFGFCGVAIVASARDCGHEIEIWQKKRREHGGR